jgi:hypothetical protein
MTKRTADDYEAQQAKEWTTYVARVPINFYGVRAYNTGDPVPVSAVEGAAGWVATEFVDKTSGRGSAEPFAGSATVVDAGPPTVDPATVAAPAASSPSAITSTEG